MRRGRAKRLKKFKRIFAGWRRGRSRREASALHGLRSRKKRFPAGDGIVTVHSAPAWTGAGKVTSVQRIADGGEASAVVCCSTKSVEGKGHFTTPLPPE